MRLGCQVAWKMSARPLIVVIKVKSKKRRRKNSNWYHCICAGIHLLNSRAWNWAELGWAGLGWVFKYEYTFIKLDLWIHKNMCVCVCWTYFTTQANTQLRLFGNSNSLQSRPRPRSRPLLVSASASHSSSSARNMTQSSEKNVLGGPLEVCSKDPMTGWTRTGCCETGAISELLIQTLCRQRV